MMEENMVYMPVDEEFDNCYKWEGMHTCWSSGDGGLSAASKSIVSERNRRKKLNDRLHALRAVVPNITKMDKASIVKDAIEYIESMHSEERRIQAEISEMEEAPLLLQQPQSNAFSPQKLMENNHCNYSRLSTSAPSPASFAMQSSADTHPIQLHELRVSSMGNNNTLVVSLSCSKGRDTMVKLCNIFESLDLKIITANITAFPGRLYNTLFVEGDDDEKEVLSFRIRAAIAALNDPDSPVSI